MIGVPVFASLTLTCRPLPALKVTVTVPGVALVVFCELTTLYLKVIVTVALPAGAVVGVATNEPSGLSVTVPLVAEPATMTGFIGRPEGSVAWDRTPGDEIRSCDATLLL